MATTTTSKAPATSTNGVLTAPAPVQVNRKKAKRRAKQQAKSAQQLPAHHIAGQQTEEGYDEDALRYEEDEEDDDYDSEADYDHPDDHHYAPHAPTNGVHRPPPPLMSSGGSKKGKKKQSDTMSLSHAGAYDPRLLPPPSGPLSLRASNRGNRGGDAIWHTSMQQERENIKHFWLNLTEDERKRLLRIEKEAVLKKMKQQQKHSCSCQVCGRKRLAIEDELELLYEGYYAELEQYAHHDVPALPSSDGLVPDPLQHRRPHPLETLPPPLHHPHHRSHNHNHHRTSQIHEVLDDEDEYSDEEEEEEEEEYSDEEEDEEYSDDEPEPEPEPPRGHPGVPDFFNFGTHLTVKDNLLTVADDLLKNDGRKFIEMMEQLAERRLQREQRIQYESDAHSGYPPGDPTYDHQDQMDGDEFDDEEDSYNSQEEYDDEIEEEEDLVGDMKMEGRRMFQIFAARMFEQRVLTAYKEKVAAERQQKLLDELEDDAKLQAQREAKKQRDAQKKKDKKKQQQMAKAEEKAKRDAEKAEDEARIREAEEKKQEEQRRKKEEQRRKREEEKKKQEEEKARKEAEKLKRQQDEQQRREETERKAREQKAAEKAKKEEQRKREREEREAREKEVREKKAQDEKDRKEREAKAKAEARDRERIAQQAANAYHMAHPPTLTTRPSHSTVAIPGVFGKQTPSGVASPHPSIPTPAIPKAPTPSKPRQASRQGSHASSPKQTQSQLSSAPSKSSSPGSSGAQQAQTQPKQILQKSGHHQVNHQNQHYMNGPSPLHHQPIQPPPGMPHPQQFPPGGFGCMPPMGFQNFQGPRGPMGMPNVGQRGPMPMFQQQQPPHMGFPNGLGFGAPGMNGMGPPPGMMMPQHGRPFPFDNGPGIMGQPPPGFAQHQSHHPNHTSSVGQPPTSGIESQRQSISGHSRQPSSDRDRLDSAANQPIARPAPIQRPGSVRPPGPDRPGSNGEVDDLSKHLGSSALLDDSADEPMPNGGDVRRHSSMATNPRGINIPGAGMAPMSGGFGGFGAPGTSWGNTPAAGFGQSPALGGPGWGALPPQVGSWGASNGAGFANNNHFSSFGAPINGPRGGPQTRPITVRQLLCTACRELSRSGEEYHKVDAVIQHIMARNPPLDFAPDAAEVKDITTVEGDSRNGGGELHFREHDDGSKDIKWTQDASTPDQGHRPAELAAIGSPAVGKSSPAFGVPGAGRGAVGLFQNLGAIGSSGS